MHPDLTAAGSPTRAAGEPAADVAQAGTDHGHLADIPHIARRIRVHALERTVAGGGGYLSQACSAAELLATLYGAILRLGPLVGDPFPAPFRAVPGHPEANPTGRRFNGAVDAALDRFILSPSHYALALYASLVAVGRLAPEALESFNADGSTLEMIGAEHSPGFELTTGSMGQALSQAIGVALARRWRRETGAVWVFMGDGELQEGQVWEAVQFAGVQRLDSLRVIVDVNGQQVDGRTADVLDNGPLLEKFSSFGALALAVDGHDPTAVHAAASTPSHGRPLIILAHTDPAHGLPLLEGRSPKLHYVRIRDADEHAQFTAALEALRTEGDPA